jgi:pSer/pThr/pTyr-binding forkhead associated (FHA) protein
MPGSVHRAIAAFLVSAVDRAEGPFWPLRLGRNKIGRDVLTVDVIIPHGATHNSHAIIDCGVAGAVLSDVGTTNGTFVNEEYLGFQGKRALRDGCVIRFGGYSAVFLALRCVRGHAVPSGGLWCGEGRHPLDEDPRRYRRH